MALDSACAPHPISEDRRMRALLFGLLMAFPFWPATAEQLVFLRSDLSVDADGGELSTDLAILLASVIETPMAVEYYPTGRIGEALSVRGRSTCSLVGATNLTRLALAPAREISRSRIVIAALDPAPSGVEPAIGAFNSYAYRRAAQENGIVLHTVPSFASAVGMLRAGRLTEFVAAEAVIATLTRSHGLRFGPPRELETLSLWLGCSADSSPDHRAALSKAWGRLLQTGQAQALFARHHGEEGLFKP